MRRNHAFRRPFVAMRQPHDFLAKCFPLRWLEQIDDEDTGELLHKAREAGIAFRDARGLRKWGTLVDAPVGRWWETVSAAERRPACSFRI